MNSLNSDDIKRLNAETKDKERSNIFFIVVLQPKEQIYYKSLNKIKYSKAVGSKLLIFALLISIETFKLREIIIEYSSVCGEKRRNLDTTFSKMFLIRMLLD